MDNSLSLDTTFLIDLEREIARRTAGPARAFLEQHSQQQLYLSFIVAGELAAGASLDERPRWEDFLAPFRILPSSDDVAWEYGQLYRYLRANGLLIGGNDLWIAATALAHGLPVVTRNEVHFGRVPGLRVVSYAVE